MKIENIKIKINKNKKLKIKIKNMIFSCQTLSEYFFKGMPKYFFMILKYKFQMMRTLQASCKEYRK